MGIERVQERSAGKAIRASRHLEPRRVVWSRVATDHVVPRTPGIVHVVDAKLSLVEQVEGLSPKLDLAAFSPFEVFQQGEIGVETGWIIQRVPPRVAEGESPGSDKLRRISQQRSEAL